MGKFSIPRNGIVTGAIILTLAGIITRILGFVYRIYMSNIMGAEGMGLYQLIMPVYALAWSLSCSGFTTTISKLVAQERACGEYGNIRRLLKLSIAVTVMISFVLSLGLYLSADFIAVNIFHDPRTAPALKLLPIAFPFMAAGSCLRGYFFGMQETHIPAINQVFEQLVRMFVIYLLAGTFMPLGLEYACGVAIVGCIAEEIFSLFYITAAYKKFGLKKRRRPSMHNHAALVLLLSMALPLTANRVTGSLLSTVENILIPLRLQLFGMSSAEAISAYGKLTGMAMPIIYFPSAFLISLSISLVPAVSEASAKMNYARIQYAASRSILFAAIVGFGAASLFCVFSAELGQIIYKQDLSQTLTLLGLMCPFLYMQVVLSGVLNGLGYQLFLFRNSIISSAITIAFVYFLIPEQGINAFILGWFLALIVTCALEIGKLRSKISLEFEFANWFLKPLICASASGMVVKYFADRFLMPSLGQVAGLLTSVAALGLLYMTLVLVLGCLSLNEIRGMFKSKP